MEDFVKCVSIICFRFLNEEGLLLVQGSIDEHHYTIGSAILPVLDIKEVSESHKNSLEIFTCTVCPTDMTRSWMWFQVDFMAVVNKLDLEVLRWTTTVRCSTHYFTVLRRKSCKNEKQHLHKLDIWHSTIWNILNFKRHLFSRPFLNMKNLKSGLRLRRVIG